MPYVARDTEGRVTALFARAEEGCCEHLPVVHPDVIAFLVAGEGSGGADDFGAQVAEMKAVIEEMLGILLARNALIITDLSPASQKYVVTNSTSMGAVLDSPLCDGEELYLPG